MEPQANLERTSPASGAKPVAGVALSGALHPQPSVDGGHSLAEMAQRDLDAALQLLADRAQYITGASGAAIALRRDGKKDMLCRASTGPNAPELGALLSTEFGLSGESVRTRQPLRCDDAERDLRVNREVCRQMGIASVVVMPVVNDDEVLGVFELFSGKANAFGARDLSAVQRLSEMVETAVRLAQATETLPERLKMPETLAPELKTSEASEVEAPRHPTGKAQALETDPVDGEILAGELLADIVLEDPVLEDPAQQDPGLQQAGLHEAVLEVVADRAESPMLDGSAARLPIVQENAVPHAKPESHLATSEPREDAGATAPAVETTLAAPVAENASTKKSLFWSAAPNPAADAGPLVEPDQSHVPPMLRSLRKCEACGFPVSAGRALCVECEEKKWRGQLRVPKPGAPRSMVVSEKPGASSKPEARAFAAAAQAAAPARSATSNTAPEVRSIPAAPSASVQASSGSAARSAHSTSVQPSSAQPAKAPAPAFVFSAGLAPSQSWLATNKYVLGVLLVVCGAVAAFFLLR